jgi:hypothetical protein
MAISSALGSSALLPAGLGFRNVLINGEFRINQRGYTSASNLASGSYGFDRWKSTFTNTTLTFTSAPQGQIVTINSGGSIEQVIERENITAGTFVLSWTGTATGRVYNTGATPPSYASSPIVVTLDGLANVEVEFTASGGTQTLWKPQLEQNLQPTPFEQRPIGVELALCKRYYWRISSANASNNYARLTQMGFQITQGVSSFSFLFEIPMRATPTIGGANAEVSDDVTFASVIYALSIDSANGITVTVNATHPTSGSALKPILIRAANSTASYLDFTAEL